MTSPDGSWRKRCLPAWSKTLALKNPCSSSVAFVFLPVIIVACQSHSEHGICTLHAVFFQHALHITFGWQHPELRTQVPRTHMRLCGTGKERESDFHGETLLHLAGIFMELEPTTIQSLTCTAMNTLRARSTKSVRCASAWKSRDASLKPFTVSFLYTPHHVVV